MGYSKLRLLDPNASYVLFIHLCKDSMSEIASNIADMFDLTGFQQTRCLQM